MNRRTILSTSSVLAGILMAGLVRPRAANAASVSGANYLVVHTDAEWRRLLSPCRLSGAAAGRHGSPLFVAPPARGAGRSLQLRRLRAAALFVRDQIRQRHWLAKLLEPPSWRDPHFGR